jgi:rsbT co-antagonist protein RsbR
VQEFNGFAPQALPVDSSNKKKIANLPGRDVDHSKSSVFWWPQSDFSHRRSWVEPRKGSRMPVPERGVVDDGLRFPESDIQRRKEFVGLGPDDLSRLAMASPLVTARASQYVVAFFNYLARFEETATLFAGVKALEEARQLKRDHLAAMMRGDYGRRYVDQRLRLAKIYSDAKLEVRIFLGAYRHLMSTIGVDLMERFADNPSEGFKTFGAVEKIGFFDMGIIIDHLLVERERTIALQQEAIRDLSTPVLQLRRGLLLLPIIGEVDTRRAQLLTDGLLLAIRSTRARVVVMDITGVRAINADVAHHLVQTVEAARLIGVVVILSGLSPAVAQALVELGVELSAYEIVGDLQSGVERSEHLLGYRVVGEGPRGAVAHLTAGI